MDTPTQLADEPRSNLSTSQPPPNKHEVRPVTPPEHESTSGLFGSEFRALSIGMLGLVSLIAFEAMGSATVMPVAATALDGLARYGFLFGGPLAAGIVAMVVAGSWSDRHSPLRVARAGMGFFVSGLLLAGLAGSMGTLLLGRLATGFGSGMLAVALYALVGRLYPARLHSAVFAAFSAAWIVPALLGPAACGLVTEFLGWRWALLGIALLGLAVGLKLMMMRMPSPTPDTQTRPATTRTLIWALAAASGALVLHLLGQTGKNPDSATFTPVALAAMAAALALLIAASRQLLPIGTLAARPGLPAAIALSGLSQGAFFAAEAFLPLMLVRERDMPIGVAGLLLSVGAVSWSIGAACRARAHGKVSDRRILRIGFALLAAGIALSTAVLVPAVPVLVAILAWAAAGAGMGLVSPTLSVKTLALSPPGQHGRTGAALRLSAALSTTSTLALSGALFAMLYVKWPDAAFATSMGLAASLAMGGLLIAGRSEVRAALQPTLQA